MIEYSQADLVIDVAFVQQHFTAQDVVARKRVTDELQAAQRKLLAFFDRDYEIDNAFVRFCGIVFEGRRRFGRVFDEALLAVILLQILKQGFADLLTVGDVAFVEANDGPNRVFGDRSNCPRSSSRRCDRRGLP